MVNLGEPVTLNRAALNLRPEGHRYRILSPGDLANSLLMRFALGGRGIHCMNRESLERQVIHIALCHWEASKTPYRHTMTAVGGIENLEKSITAKRTALEFWDCTRRSPVLNCFIGEPCGCSVHALEHAGRIDDLKEAIALDHVALELRLEGQCSLNAGAGS